MPAVASAVRGNLLVPGPKLVLMAVLALPATVVGLSASPGPGVVSCIIAAVWFAVLPASLYSTKARQVLPFVAAGLLIFAAIAFPFNSPDFVADYWTAAPMLLLALPAFERRRPPMAPPQRPHRQPRPTAHGNRPAVSLLLPGTVLDRPASPRADQAPN